MREGARLAAAIAVLDEIAASTLPADEILKAWGRGARYAGAKDRRAVADRVYACLRERGRLAARMGSADGRALVLAALRAEGATLQALEVLFDGGGHAPAPLTAAERGRLDAWSGLGAGPGLPDFLARELAAGFGAGWEAEADALLTGRAGVDVRVDTLKGEVGSAAAALSEAGLSPEPGALSAVALRLGEARADLAALPLFQDGRIEVQDEGSQIAAWLAGARPGEVAVDYCAGGGGKTLALGQAMGGTGRLVACDVEPRRLAAVAPRLKRAGLAAELVRLGRGAPLAGLEGRADLVLVDAPCSGSGVWRRRPETAWRLTEAEIARLSALQSDVLAAAAGLVRPGGRLAYVTCSVLHAENGAVAARFEAARPDFRPRAVAAAAAQSPFVAPAGRRRLAELAGEGHTLQMSPARTGTDGFFIALYERSA